MAAVAWTGNRKQTSFLKKHMLRKMSSHWDPNFKIPRKDNCAAALYEFWILFYILLLFLLEWYATAVIALSALGVLAFAAAMVTITLCYLRRPEKTPVALVSMLITKVECQQKYIQLHYILMVGAGSTVWQRGTVGVYPTAKTHLSSMFLCRSAHYTQ